jgi:putative lipoprotein
MRRIESVLLAFALVAALAPAGAAVAADPAVSGTIVTKEKVALTPAAVAVVTIVDQEATGAAGSIIGQQRIDGAAFPVSFSVPYDAGAIDPDRSYALFASIVDGGRTYQSVEPVPVITGGPTSGITVQVVPVPSGAGTVTGSMARTDDASLSAEAVAIAALIRQDTGTLVARQVIPDPGSGTIAFAIPYDPGIIDPGATYVVRV